MTRNLKAFGLALVAAMALGAIGAQGASAAVVHSFNSASEHTVLTGKTESYSNSENKSIETFTATAELTVECYGTYEGTISKKEVDTVTVHPKYSGCKGGASVHTSGCNYIFGSDTTEDANHSASTEHASVSLECEASHWIEITRPGCNITFGDEASSKAVNQSLHGVTYKNVKDPVKHAITVTATVRTIHYEVTSGSFCGLAGHPAGTYKNGKLDGLVEVTGFESSIVESGSTTNGVVWKHGAQTDITISGTP